MQTTITVKTQVTVDDQRVKDLLCNALEGGSNYWYNIEGFINPNHITVEHKHIDLPFIDGCGLVIDDGDGRKFTLNRHVMEKGLQVMGEKYPNHFNDFITENDDAETGDVFLQCCLFNDVIFG